MLCSSLTVSILYPLLLAWGEAPPLAYTTSLVCASVSVGAAICSVLFKCPSRGHVVGRVAGLNYYPIKSCAGTAVDAQAVDRYGPQCDRRLMVVSADAGSKGAHPFLTQRQLPSMALIHTEQTGIGWLVRNSARKGSPPLEIASSCGSARRLRVRVWDEDSLTAVDMGDEAAEWFSKALGQACRVVSSEFGDWRRGLSTKYTPWELRVFPGAPDVGFADGFPFLLVTEASLAGERR